jgi:hypothetical protein
VYDAALPAANMAGLQAASRAGWVSQPCLHDEREKPAPTMLTLCERERGSSRLFDCKMLFCLLWLFLMRLQASSPPSSRVDLISHKAATLHAIELLVYYLDALQQ